MNLKSTAKIPIDKRGYLVLIQNPTVEQYEQLAAWRRKNRRWFRDEKPVTLKSTEQWWKTVQKNPLRVLFWVIDKKGNTIGHMGLNRFKGTSCELDNVIRGPNLSPGLMSLAVTSFVKWVLKTLPVKSIYLQTNYDNLHAIKFYQRCGFKIITNAKPLIRMKYIGKRDTKNDLMFE